MARPSWPRGGKATVTMTTPHEPNKRLYTLRPAEAEAFDRLLAARTPEGTLHLADDRPTGPKDAATAADPAAQRVAAVLGLLDQCPAEDPPADLLTRALERVADERQRLRFARQLEAVSSPPVAFRWTELITVAAVLMLGVAVIWPLLARTSSQARQAACAGNERGIGQAVAAYAAGHQGLMPSVGSNRSLNTQVADNNLAVPNLVNLYEVVRATGVDPNLFVCPDNRAAPSNVAAATLLEKPTTVPPSYSYQNQVRPQRLTQFSMMPIVADKNPLLEQSADDQFAPARSDSRVMSVRYRSGVPADSPSQFHDGRGQNILRADGSVFWAASPVVRPGMVRPIDNIWINDAGNDQPLLSGDAQLIH